MSKYKILLIVDLQKEFADTDNNSHNYNKLLDFIKENGDKGSYNKIISTCFRNEENPNFRCNLNWYECDNTNIDSLEYLSYIEKLEHTIIFKDGYSDRSNHIISAIKKLNNTVHEGVDIDIIGCDIDACVMAICFQLWDAGITNFKVLTEFCYTTAKDFTKDEVIKIMRRNFGKCIV